MGKGLWAPGMHCILTQVTFKKGLQILLLKKPQNINSANVFPILLLFPPFVFSGFFVYLVI